MVKNANQNIGKIILKNVIQNKINKMSGSSRKRIKYSVPLLPLQHICKFVDMYDLFNIRLVSHKWCRLVSIPAIWKKYILWITSEIPNIPFKYDPWTQLAQLLCIGNVEPEQMCKYFSRQDRYQLCEIYVRYGHHLYCRTSSPLQFYNSTIHKKSTLDIDTCMLIEDNKSYPIMSIVKRSIDVMHTPWF